MTYFTGLVIGTRLVALVYVLLGLALAVGILVRAASAEPAALDSLQPRDDLAADPAPEHPPWSWSGRLQLAGWLPLTVFAGVVILRFGQAAELALPAWVDSVHHALLVRLIAEAGRVPLSFEPYMPVQLYYHFGFHTNAALFSRLAQLSADQGILHYGQLMNAFVALATYRLGIALWKDWRRALVAMLFVGFVFQMPAYYLTWGRYTLLSGLVLMALSMSAALDVARVTQVSRFKLLNLALLTLGTLLTHYFAAILLAVFFGVLALDRMVRSRGSLADSRLRGLVLAGLLGLLVATPWLLHVVRESAGFIGLSVVAPGQDLDAVYFSNYLGYLQFLLGPRRSHLVHSMALVLFALIAWRRPTRPLGLWALIVGLLSLPWASISSHFGQITGRLSLFCRLRSFMAISPGSCWIFVGRLRCAEISAFTWRWG